jgi:hypothetical protein
MTLKLMSVCLAVTALAGCAGGTATTLDANPVASVENDTVEGMTEPPDSANPDDPFDDSLGTEM